MKLGEQLLVAQQNGKQDMTRLVQIQPTLHNDQPVAEKPIDRPVVAVSNNVVEKTVLFQVRVYEVDHGGWTKEQGVEKRKQALDEVLRPWIGSARGSKLEKVNVKAWTVKELAPAGEIEKLGNVVRLVSEPKLAVVEGHTGSFDYGGKTPQLRLIELKNGGTSEGNSQVRPLATTFALEPDVTDAGRVLLNVYFNPHGELHKKRSSNDDLKRHGVKAAAELSVGQTLCLSDARPESSDNEDSLLVTITPYEIATREVEKRIPPVAAAPAKTKELEITVEDRWPTADIKVGQRVVAVPVTIEKTSLQADLTAMVFAFESKSSQRVTRIEPLPNQVGRRVTISVPFNQHEEATDQLKTIVENYLDAARTSTSTFVIPASTVSQADLWNGRPVQELYEHIPIERRPRPVELTVGESFTAIGVAGLITQSQTEAHHEFGPLNLSLVDKDAGGVWRATATKSGMTRLIQFAIGRDLIGPARLTEYLVKADTRELELHIRQQFPSAKVAITSVGSNAVMLKGTVASNEDATGIVELAEQFAPKVLNRLKVGATQASTEMNPVRQANGVAEESGSQRDSNSVSEPQVAEPQRVRLSKSARDVPQKSAELQQLRDEIRELRQDVRDLIQRLDREQAATPKANGNTKPSIKLGRNDQEFNTLILEFNELMEQKRFAEAEVVAKKASDIDPDNPLSQTLLFKAQLSRRFAAKEQRQPTADTSTLPLSNAIQVNSLQKQPAAVGFTENDVRIVQQLNAVVELEAVDLPLSKVVELLARKANINIVLDKAGLEEAGVAGSVAVNCTLSGVALRSVLNLVLNPLKLSYVIDGEVLTITSSERAAGPAVVVAYPVADLLHDNETVSEELEHYINLIRSNVAPASWDKVGGQGSIVRQDATKSLFVRQTKGIHDELQEFLNLLRKSAKAANTTRETAGLAHFSPEEIRITKQLQRSVSVDLEQVTLKEAVRKLETLADINMLLDERGLEDESLSSKTPVSLRLKDVRLATALRVLLEPLNLAYVVKDEVMVITSRPRADGELVVATYPVNDLLRDSQPPREELDRLCELIQNMIEPHSWSEVGGAADIKSNPPTQSLVVRQTAANQTRIRELLEAMRSVGKHTTTNDR